MPGESVAACSPTYPRAALYWGPGSSLNSSVALPADATRPLAFLLAATQAVLLAHPLRLLRISADCDYLHRVLAHWAPSLALAHWDCAHADSL
ncbi:hypothetical protein FKP32DRAFT_1583683, partial [Trametes sanguinea]